MEEVGTQVASPLFIHQNIGGRFCEGALIGAKRGLCYNSGTNHHQQQQHSQNHRSGHGWNPKDWEWDSSHFVARNKPIEASQRVNPILSSSFTSKSSSRVDDQQEQDGGGSLRLQLGGVGDSNVTGTSINKVQSSNSTDDPASSSRPNKKVRSGSPGTGGNHPMCQVDNCTEDLSKSKDYHRRHKVCEFHSKSTKALVGKQMQRFCQQCSRFHPLAEFDEGKRSCRRRLAGHNKRRRKTQAEDTPSPPIQPTKTAYGNLDIVNLLTVLARGQGNAEQNVSTCPSLPDKNQLIQILSKMNTLPMPMDIATNPLVTPGSTKNGFEQGALMEVNAASRSTTDLLAVLSSTLAASSPNSVPFISQRSNPGSCMVKNKSTTGDKDTGSDACKKTAIELQSLGGERSSSSYQSPTEDSDSQVQDTRMNLPLQLFSSSPGDDSSPNLVSSRRYFSSDSSNPTEERSHSSTAPVTRKLFPLETTSGSAKPARMSFGEEANVNIEATSGSRMTLDLFTMGNRAVSNSLQSLPHQAGYTSSSGSDHSPPSFNSDPQKDRTGRIIFKLFDKDPSQLPGALRTQIYNWLSNSPTEMESYIRPGCVVLSIYVSMSSAAWEQLEESFLQRVEALVQDPDFEFWRSGRFSANIGRQLAVHKDGRIRICKPWSTVSSPELFLVSPLAVVSGQSTSLVLGGRNLTSPGTKIHCTYMGGYSSKAVLRSSDEGFTCDEVELSDFKVHAAASSVLGRCFIEVENGVRGNCFPVIIADAKICQELRLLEREFYEAKVGDVVMEDQVQYVASPHSHEEALHFLNELGWLFQRQLSSDIAVHDFMLHRLQYLLTFSTERDYCALVKTLLDIFVEAESRMDGLSAECVEALAKMHLLHRAVKRSSKKMVDMLIHYSAPCGSGASKKYIFPPNLRGPGGITPLHLAACTSGSYDIIDVLTDDPMQIGLHCWKSLVDDSGQSPYSYALMRNNNAVNNIVARKLSDRINRQVSVTIGNEIVESFSGTAEMKQRASLKLNTKQNSCSKCAMMSYGRMQGSHGFLHRPFIHSMLTIAAVCVCVCLFFKSMHVNSVTPFMWDNVDFGAI
ncbi:squamosa promoter-binding-like protein 14 [Spinacia oleracea]|uniref:Squamosa promoter-binding-like protein 14 n=1 Tax=Spinacia oleracea TaxID=3562 RepID=A0A9R0JJF9_SPIOL|nr:squamosa promoter-binding-like protein 14 [Spinacia oleracea]XP_021836588.2 squamosa promoter-binding-like protein 14 [Spinacia oleracea]